MAKVDPNLPLDLNAAGVALGISGNYSRYPEEVTVYLTKSDGKYDLKGLLGKVRKQYIGRAIQQVVHEWHGGLVQKNYIWHYLYPRDGWQTVYFPKAGGGEDAVQIIGPYFFNHFRRVDEHRNFEKFELRFYSKSLLNFNSLNITIGDVTLTNAALKLVGNGHALSNTYYHLEDGPYPKEGGPFMEQYVTGSSTSGTDKDGNPITLNSYGYRFREKSNYYLYVVNPRTPGALDTEDANGMVGVEPYENDEGKTRYNYRHKWYDSGRTSWLKQGQSISYIRQGYYYLDTPIYFEIS
jgi:hypothetical protein